MHFVVWSDYTKRDSYCCNLLTNTKPIIPAKLTWTIKWEHMGNAACLTVSPQARFWPVTLVIFVQKLGFAVDVALKPGRKFPHPRKKTMGQVSTCLLLACNVVQTFRKNNNGQTIVQTKFIPHEHNVNGHENQYGKIDVT